MIDADLVRDLIDYDRATGRFIWKARDVFLFKTPRDCSAWNTRHAGRPALTARHGAGYLHGSLMGSHILAHRAAWVIEYGEWPIVVDHINGIRHDNRLENLRSVSHGENNRNQRLGLRNKSGAIGVFQRKDGRYLANIRVCGRTKYLGIFTTFEEAREARRIAQETFGYHPGHGSRSVGDVSESAA